MLLQLLIPPVIKNLSRGEKLVGIAHSPLIFTTSNILFFKKHLLAEDGFTQWCILPPFSDAMTSPLLFDLKI